MSAIKCLDNFKNFQFALAIYWKKKKTFKDSAETFIYYVANNFGMPQYFAKAYDLAF